MRRNILIASLAMMLALPLLGINPQAASALTVSPVLVEYNVDPGDALVGSVKLRNEGTETLTFYSGVQDFEAAGEDGAPSFIGTSPTRSLVSWVNFGQSFITLKPGESEFVTYNINVPRDAAPGGYFGGLLFSTNAPGTRDGVGVSAVTGVLLLMDVAGDVTERGMITDFAVSEDTVTSLPVDFTVRFKNEGSVHLKPAGVVRVTNMFGSTSAVLRVNEEQGNVLPDSTRRFEASWQKSDLPENTSEFTKEWKNFAFGPYTATLVMNYGESGVASATTSFWAIPWLLVVLFIILLVILGLLVVQYNQWVVGRAMKGSSMKKK